MTPYTNTYINSHILVGKIFFYTMPQEEKNQHPESSDILVVLKEFDAEHFIFPAFQFYPRYFPDELSYFSNFYLVNYYYFYVLQKIDLE